MVFLWRALECLAGRRARVKAAVVTLLVRCFASILAMLTLSPRSVQTREYALCNASIWSRCIVTGSWWPMHSGGFWETCRHLHLHMGSA